MVVRNHADAQIILPIVRVHALDVVALNHADALNIKTMNKPNFNTMLRLVLDGLKEDIPVFETLHKYGWNRHLFYLKTTEEHKRMFAEIKCLRRNVRGNATYVQTTFTDIADADYSEIDVGVEELHLDYYEDIT